MVSEKASKLVFKKKSSDKEFLFNKQDWDELDCAVTYSTGVNAAHNYKAKTSLKEGETPFTQKHQKG